MNIELLNGYKSIEWTRRYCQTEINKCLKVYKTKNLDQIVIQIFVIDEFKEYFKNIFLEYF